MSRRLTVDDFWKKVAKSDDCWIWQASLHKDGYGQLYFHGKFWLAHRFSYTILVGEIPEGMCVCHNCPGGDNPACVNPAHLFLGTHTDNMRDMEAKKRSLHYKGSSHGRSKLTEQDVIQIRKSHPEFNQNQLARMYGVTGTNIGAILKRETWTHI